MPKLVWRLKSYPILLFISEDFHACHKVLAFLDLSSPFCSHETKRKKMWLVQNHLGMNRDFKCYSSLKFAKWNQKAILIHHNLFSLFANHKKIILLRSQKERGKEMLQVVQTKASKLSKQKASKFSKQKDHNLPKPKA